MQDPYLARGKTQTCADGTRGAQEHSYLCWVYRAFGGRCALLQGAPCSFGASRDKKRARIQRPWATGNGDDALTVVVLHFVGLYHVLYE